MWFVVDRNVVMLRIPVFYSPVNAKHIFGIPCSVSVEITYGRHTLFLLFFLSVCSQLAQRRRTETASGRSRKGSPFSPSDAVLANQAILTVPEHKSHAPHCWFTPSPLTLHQRALCSDVFISVIFTSNTPLQEASLSRGFQAFKEQRDGQPLESPSFIILSQTLPALGTYIAQGQVPYICHIYK